MLGRDAFRALSAERLAQARASFIPAELLGSGLAPLTAAQVRGVRRPVLLVNGERSPRVFHRFNDRLQRLLPRAERVTIPGASHITHEDNAPSWREAVLSFLARQRAVAGHRSSARQIAPIRRARQSMPAP